MFQSTQYHGSANVNGAINFRPEFVPAPITQKQTPADPFERFIKKGASVRLLLAHGEHSLNWLLEGSDHNGTFHLCYRDADGSLAVETVGVDDLIPRADALGFEADAAEEGYGLTFSNCYIWTHPNGDTWYSLSYYKEEGKEECANFYGIPLHLKEEIKRHNKLERDRRYRTKKARRTKFYADFAVEILRTNLDMGLEAAGTCARLIPYADGDDKENQLHKTALLLALSIARRAGVPVQYERSVAALRAALSKTRSQKAQTSN